MLDLQRDVKRLYPVMEPPRLCIFTQEPKLEGIEPPVQDMGVGVTIDVRPIEDLKIYIPPKKSPFAPSIRKGTPHPHIPSPARDARRRRVLAIWNLGEHDSWKIAKMLKSTRGAIYNDLRALGIKK